MRRKDRRGPGITNSETMGAGSALRAAGLGAGRGAAGNSRANTSHPRRQSANKAKKDKKLFTAGFLRSWRVSILRENLARQGQGYVSRYPVSPERTNVRPKPVPIFNVGKNTPYWATIQ